MPKPFRLRVNEAFHLSEIQPSDSQSLVRWLNEPELHAKTLRIPSPYREQDAAEFIRLVAGESSEFGGPFTFAIRDSEQQLVGGLGFEALTRGHRAEVGYWLAKPYRGRGVMTATLRVACEFAFREWRLARIGAYVFPDNVASAVVLERCGFQFEGRLRKFHRKDERLLDTLSYARVE